MKYIEKIKFFWNAILPPPEWRVPVMLVAGVVAGMTLALLHLSRATSYLSDEPETCMNCHVMGSAFASWQMSNHAHVATCNDCHVPQDNVFKKYFFKAMDGSRHSFMFTFRLEPQVITIKNAGKNVVEQNCIRCHGNAVHLIDAASMTVKKQQQGDGMLCFDCHRDIPHGREMSLSTFPHANLPKLKMPLMGK